MSRADITDLDAGPWCCVCGDEATVRILKPGSGVRTVCDDHRRDYEVVEHVE